ncbi:MAG: DUF1178 family protein [Phreatobacter sp.]|uniref:DUF1178 family protein n=1 Tax=Phreatobacter sp. TaxID=1966341 RepID=UPI0027360510|nr:DUF1178 family protein [Phreatobacter sp.]MDP2802742.1 DUF1178 family protein [Phreatobacter sp.]
MIRYALQCEKAHAFESWFPSSDSYEAQRKQGFVACPVCGSTRVDKALMAPQVARKDRRAAAESTPPAAAPPAPVAMVSPAEQELRAKIRELREHLVQNADPVGERFAEEARKIHYGETEHRSIYGRASPDEARELAEEGIEFHALPVLPDDRN